MQLIISLLLWLFYLANADKNKGEALFFAFRCAKELKFIGDGLMDQVPISQEDRYFSCSGVRLSITTPIEASFNLAISWSIARGTG